MAPRLEPLRTERLLLRPFSDADLPSVIGIQAAAETHPHEPAPASSAQARTQFDLWRRHWADHGFGYVAVVEHRSGTVVGVGGVQRSDLDGRGVLNLYYRFRPDAWGRGYAPEMARAILAWVDRAVPELPVVIVTNIDNGPARRVAEKLGFREYKRDLYRGMPAVYYRRSTAAGDRSRPGTAATG
ncbi:GNAT family N-acetyltransferase [Saccharomonospora iraqiensis]|uniref:GNAT family N-acetyltransferase n=1 Tax=Saccharomonospora iraqiensis TaxID=52698 RepID=UPI00022E07B3|nr:GNAT family N-acetyltransferase [Saccharomonospora iraqiensis]